MLRLAKPPASRPPPKPLPGRAEPLVVAPTHYVNGNSMRRPYPDGMAQALFGMGCFWGAERKFWTFPGVFVTAVGYAGGHTPNPTYEEVCSGQTGHTEVVRVVFDPRVVSFEEILTVFWENHDPTQGMRQGQRRRHAVPLGGVLVRRGAARGDRDVARRVRARARGGGPRRHHDRGGARAGVLLRRGLSPAVPREESRRLLRHRGTGVACPTGAAR